jgi:hypothetical protein
MKFSRLTMRFVGAVLGLCMIAPFARLVLNFAIDIRIRDTPRGGVVRNT